MTHDEFMEFACPDIERQVDAHILAEPDLQDRLLLMRHRQLIVGKLVDLTAIVDLQRRVAELEDRQPLRLVAAQ
jgi:hypothetical protein